MGSWKKWSLSLMPRSTQEDWAPLRSLLCKLMVSFMDTKFHPWVPDTQASLCRWQGVLEKESDAFISAPKRSINITAPKSLVSPHVTHTMRKWHPRKLALAALTAKAGLKNTSCLRKALGFCSTFIWQCSWMPCLYPSKHQVCYSHSLIWGNYFLWGVLGATAPLARALSCVSLGTVPL